MAEKKSSFPKYSNVLVTTPRGVARFPSVHKTDSYMGGPEKFKATIVFDGDADTGKIIEGALAIAAQVYPTRKPDKVNVLLKDGDEAEKDGKPIEELASKFYLNASSNKDHPPKVVGPDKKPLPEGVEVRSGDIIKLVVSPIPSDTPVKGSIAFRLMAVQLIEKRSGPAVDTDTMFDDEGPGLSGGFSATASSGVDAGPAADDDDLPF